MFLLLCKTFVIKNKKIEPGHFLHKTEKKSAFVRNKNCLNTREKRKKKTFQKVGKQLNNNKQNLKDSKNSKKQKKVEADGFYYLFRCLMPKSVLFF